MRLNRGAETTTDHEIDTYVQNWLKGATDRGGGREQRRRRKESCMDQAAPSEPGSVDG